MTGFKKADVVVDATGKLFALFGRRNRKFLGGSVPGIYSVTLTAAEIASRWSVGDALAMIEVPEIAAGEVLVLCWDESNTLDENCHGYDFYGYTPGATTTDVYNNGTNLAKYVAPSASSPEVTSLDVSNVLTAWYMIESGGAAYVGITGDDAPTAGSITLKVLRFAA